MDLNKINKSNKIQKKNLSPAKKFRMKLRQAKFRKFLQAKAQYFEHDNRTNVKKQKKNNKKTQQAQNYIAAYKKKTQNINEKIKPENNLKSIVTFKPQPKQEQMKQTNENQISTNINVGKCCCHCACSTGKLVTVNNKTKRKPRVKLSSPYFGEFNHHKTNNFTASNPDFLDSDLFNESSITEQTTINSQNNFNEFLQIREKTNMIKFQLINLQKKFNIINNDENEVDERFVKILQFY